MDKKFFFALMLSALTVWGLQYYFAPSANFQARSGAASVATQPVAGQPVKVPATQDLYRPLNTDIKFNVENPEAEAVESVETKLYKASFSTCGAVLTGLEFTKHLGKDGTPLKTVFKKGDQDEKKWEESCFLLALESDTPYIYKLLYRQNKHINEDAATQIKGADCVEVAYQANTDSWTITKIYTLYQDNYRIDLTMKFEPKVVEGSEIKPIRARLLFSAPSVTEVHGNQINLFTYNEGKNIIDKVDAATTKDMFWYWNTSRAMIGVEDKYFVHSLINDPAIFTQRAYFKQTHPIIEGPEIRSAQSYTMSFYMGPKLLNDLTEADDRLVNLLAFGWLSWLCKLLLQLLYFLFAYLKNYGLAILVLTVLLRLPFIPLSIFSRNKMEAYQKYQPTIQKIRQKYRQDIQMQNQELMKFHKDHNLSTATPILGCLPLLIQMPILFALYKVLGSYLDLYQAPFFGWIIDLSAKDPYYVLPILMGVTMLWQQIITPSGDEKQKIMMYFVSIVVTVLFINFPAGLVLYWATNNVVTIAEDYFRRYVLR